MKRYPGAVSVLLGAGAVLMLFISSAVAAGPWFVSPTGSDAADCLSPATACLTIQAAVNKASSGDTINVAAGTYAEHVTVNKPLTLLGANQGTVGSSTRAAESIITGDSTGAVQFTSSDIVFDGFEVSSASNALGSGIHIANGTSGYIVKNNLITGNQIGIYANSTGSSTISSNLFDGNNQPGASGGSGIYSEFTNGLRIIGNEFRNHTTNNPIIFAATAADIHQNDVIANNNIRNNGCGCSAIYALALNNASFTGNNISADSADIYLGGGNHTVSITLNNLHSTRGVNVANDGYTYVSGDVVTPFGLNTGITVNRNSLTGHSIAGVDNSQPGQTANVDAACNWWGSVTGPSGAGPGSGDPVTTGVTFSPWLTTSDLANGPCNGPLSNVTVTIIKYIGGQHATALNANSASFPMESSWNALNIGAGSGTYPLSTVGFNTPNAYEAVTSDMTAGASYTTDEITNTSVVGPNCNDNQQFRLNGYTTGDSLAAAQAGTPSATIPSFTNITTNEFVIVWNEPCTTTPNPPPANACSDLSTTPAGFTRVNGGSGNDQVTLGPNTMYVDSGGNNVIRAGDGNHIICTGSGNDNIIVGNGDNTIDAGNGNNVVRTGNGTQNVVTGSGNDNITTGSGNDTINSGNGNNVVKSGAGNDTVTTGSGNDSIDAGTGTDTCSAGAGINNKVNCEL